MEQCLTQKNTREEWRGSKTVSGYSSGGQVGAELGNWECANELVLLFNRFDSEPNSFQIHQSPDQSQVQSVFSVLCTPFPMELGPSTAPTSHLSLPLTPLFTTIPHSLSISVSEEGAEEE